LEGGGIENLRPSDDVALPLPQVHPINRGPARLAFVAAWMLVAELLKLRLGGPVFNSRHRFFPLHTATVVRRVVDPHRVRPRGPGYPPERWESRTRLTGVRIRSYAWCVRNAGNVSIAVGPLAIRTSPSSIADRGPV
jgi:hypothetical protein